ncbi:hypothetical protein ABZ990_04580 [Streptomyces sp. NPDC046203]|uniref:hypothetical protein n=1 Tax=Streptomyces sp. NPDC046203 TaxID=3154602 RepID=UPI0033E0FBB6
MIDHTNGSTSVQVVACLDRMGRSALPAAPRVQAALARTDRRGDGGSWGRGAARDEELLRTGRAVLARFPDLTGPAPAPPPQGR